MFREKEFGGVSNMPTLPELWISVSTLLSRTPLVVVVPRAFRLS